MSIPPVRTHSELRSAVNHEDRRETVGVQETKEEVPKGIEFPSIHRGCGHRPHQETLRLIVRPTNNPSRDPQLGLLPPIPPSTPVSFFNSTLRQGISGHDWGILETSTLPGRQRVESHCPIRRYNGHNSSHTRRGTFLRTGTYSVTSSDLRRGPPDRRAP